MRPEPTPGEKSDYLLNTVAGGLALIRRQNPFERVPDAARVEAEMTSRAGRGVRADDDIRAQVEAKHTPAPGMTVSGTTGQIQGWLWELARMRAAQGQPVTRTGDDTPRVSLPPGAPV